VEQDQPGIHERRAVLYLHGLPGSVAEVHAALGASSLPDGVQVLDRLGAGSEDFDTALLAAFDAAVQEPRVLVSFSAGAMSALKLAAMRPHRVSRLVLIAPAAPLELGDFLPHMAGRAVFEAARRGLWQLSLLSSAQSVATRMAPDMMLTGMFRGSPATEQALSRQPAFRRALLASARVCLSDHRAAYYRELLALVRPWAATLEQVRCKVQIIHGDADTWAPFAMAEALKARLSCPVDLVACRGLGHFSTLHQHLPDVLAAAVKR